MTPSVKLLKGVVTLFDSQNQPLFTLPLGGIVHVNYNQRFISVVCDAGRCSLFDIQGNFLRFFFARDVRSSRLLGNQQIELHRDHGRIERRTLDDRLLGVTHR